MSQPPRFPPCCFARLPRHPGAHGRGPVQAEAPFVYFMQPIAAHAHDSGCSSRCPCRSVAPLIARHGFASDFCSLTPEVVQWTAGDRAIVSTPHPHRWAFINLAAAWARVSPPAPDWSRRRYSSARRRSWRGSSRVAGLGGDGLSQGPHCPFWKGRPPPSLSLAPGRAALHRRCRHRARIP